MHFDTITTVTMEGETELNEETLKSKTAKTRFLEHRKKVGKAVKPSVNPIKKLQLSILNSSLIPIDPNPNRNYRLLHKKPINFKAFAKHMILVRKYEVLLKMEFQVRTFVVVVHFMVIEKLTFVPTSAGRLAE